MQLELEMSKRLTALNRRIVRDFTGKLANDEILQAVDFLPGVESLLLDQYNETGEFFSTRIRDDLPDEVGITAEETATIAAAIALYYLLRSGDQAKIITGTNQRQINKAVAFGVDQAVESAADGVQMTTRERALVSGAALDRAFSGRVGTITNTETNNAAEVAKQTETEVLAGATPSITSGSPRPVGVEKSWFTAGDELVRTGDFDHVAADDQAVDVSDAYVVSGEQLRWPGDMALGASIGNVANCRCGSVENRDQIISARFDTRAQIVEQVATIQ